MCGRYFVDDGMERELKNAFQSVDISKFQAKAGDVCPTDRKSTRLNSSH